VTTTVGRVSRLDGATLMKLQAGCNFINAEVQRHRSRVLVFAIACLVACAAIFKLWLPVPHVFFGGAVLVAFFFGYENKILADNYKKIVVGRVVAALADNLTYNPKSTLTKDDFLNMDLFNRRCESWQSEDEVRGRKNQVSYSIHEAKATRTEGSGKSRRTVTIFRGLIVRLDFNKNFRGHTVVVPDAESKGFFGESEERRSKQIVRLESADFENVFSVYGTDDQQARYLLTPKLMELVLKARATFAPDIRLSFHDNSLFVTVPQFKNRFEVSMFGSAITPESSLGDLAELVSLAEGLIQTLDLETRIWSRV
jgi:hypothetical protein